MKKKRGKKLMHRFYTKMVFQKFFNSPFPGYFCTIFLLSAILVSIGCNSDFKDTNKSANYLEGLNMKPMSLGRFNFSLPKEFELSGRHQSIYGVEVTTEALQDQSPDNLWHKRLERIKTKIAPGEGKLWEKEVSPGFPAVFYQLDPLALSVTVEAQKILKDHILTLKFRGSKGVEDKILQLISFTAEAYKKNAPQGFNVGPGSITGETSVNEHAFIEFENKALQTEVSIDTQTVGRVSTEHPLDDVSNEIKGLALEGIKLKVLKDKKRTVADFLGFEGLVILDAPDEEPIFRYTWFFQGEPENSFKPDILITVMGPAKHLESANEIWGNLLKSLHVRSEK